MKRAILFTMISFLILSCSKDDNKDENKPLISVEGAPTKEIGINFSKLFPNISSEAIKWEKDYEGYNVAKFSLEQIYKSSTKSSDNEEKTLPTEAWFAENGNCDMIKTDLTINDLPNTIKSKWEETTEFKEGYTPFSICYIYYNSVEIIKICTENEAEGSVDEVDLYYKSDGTLINKLVMMDIEEEDKEQKIKPIPASIHSYIEDLYPGYSIAAFDESNEEDIHTYSYAIIHDMKLIAFDFDASTKNFIAEYRVNVSFNEFPEKLRDALLKINSNVNADNTTAEVIRKEINKESSYAYMIDSDFSEFDGKSYNENGEEIN